VEHEGKPCSASRCLHDPDALILGVVLAAVVRRPIFKLLWILWPAWVWFCVMGTGNHFWLDILAGDLVAIVALLAIYRAPTRRVIAKLL
jgi:hypothetical protein